MKSILVLILVISFAATATAEGEHYIGVGLFTEHLMDDSDEYNEDNNLAYYHYKNDSLVAIAGTFENSYYIRSYVVASGMEFDLPLGAKAGVMLGLVEGYQTVLDTNCGDKIICIPLVYMKTGPFTHIMLGAAYNVSLTVKF